MKAILQTILILLMGLPSKVLSEDFSPAGGQPRLTINSVRRDPEDPKLLAVSVTIEAIGSGQLALGQEQFAVSISTKNEPWLFSARAIFPKSFAKSFAIHSEKPETFTLKAGKNEFGDKGSWEALPSGGYEIQVRLNSGKSQEFQFQWLGQTYSKPHPIKLPLAEQHGGPPTNRSVSGSHHPAAGCARSTPF